MRKINGKLAILSDFEKVLVVGDLHGDFDVFTKIVEFFKREIERNKKICLLFLGDYADRGDFGVEVIEGVIDLMKKYPKNVVALKGNHEDYDDLGNPKFMPCDLIYEVAEKRGVWRDYFESILKDFFKSLPIAAIFDRILFVHGGISSKIKELDNLIAPSENIEEDILWSDPFEGFGEYPNPRGAGVLFGRDISKRVLKSLSLEKMVRSHQPQKALSGIFVEHDGNVITINSTRVYGGVSIILEIRQNEMKPIHIL
jgi:predicted phosphodiesterase